MPKTGRSAATLAGCDRPRNDPQMKKPIRLYYYRARSGVPNFGDELSPEVVSFVTGRPVEHASRWNCDLTAIGSILDSYFRLKGRAISYCRARFQKPVNVWGSGLISNRTPPNAALRPLALRGHLTRRALNADPATPLGDPGLLAAKMMAAKGQRHGLGIVPHYTDKSHPMVAALSRLPGVRIIDVERDGPTVCAEIGSCAIILSSSLHGLVVADAFGLPNMRLRFGNQVIGGDFKFLDYASAIGRSDIAARALELPEAAISLAKADSDLGYQANLDAVCAGLEGALRRAF